MSDLSDCERYKALLRSWLRLYAPRAGWLSGKRYDVCLTCDAFSTNGPRSIVHREGCLWCETERLLGAEEQGSGFSADWEGGQLTRPQVMALSGRELDAAVAERVVGLRCRRGDPGKYWGRIGGRLRRQRTDDFYFKPRMRGVLAWPVPPYSSDQAEREILEHVYIKARLRIRHLSKDHWEAAFGEVAAQGATPGVAICRAALLAVAETEDELCNEN